MPRHTRTHKQRRIAAYTQRQRERDLIQLSGELHLLWWHYETMNNRADLDARNAGYVDPELALWSPDAA